MPIREANLAALGDMPDFGNAEALSDFIGQPCRRGYEFGAG